MVKSNNELIQRRKRKVRIKRMFLFTIILIAALVTLCLKLPYFNIKNINISNNKIVKSEQIQNYIKSAYGTNIFYLNTSKLEASFKSDPYISSVQITKKLPNTLNVEVAERNAVFFVKKGNKYDVIDNNGMVLEESSSIQNMNLIELIGVDANKLQVSKQISVNDPSELSFINSITAIILNNASCKSINKVDISNSSAISVYYNNICIKLGSADDLVKQLNEAINIILAENLQKSNGYVDVSSVTHPVYAVQK